MYSLYHAARAEQRVPRDAVTNSVTLYLGETAAIVNGRHCCVALGGCTTVARTNAPRAYG